MTAFIINPYGLQLSRFQHDANKTPRRVSVSTFKFPCLPLTNPLKTAKSFTPTRISFFHQAHLSHGNPNFENSDNGGDKNGWREDKGGRGDDQNPAARFSSAVFARRRFPEVPEWRGNRSKLEIQFERWLSQIRISHVLLAINVAVFVFQVLYGPGLMARGAKVNSAIAAGPSVESWFGKRRFLSLYVISGICGNILSYMCTPTPAVGASGAIFGLVGGTAVILARHRRLLGPRARRGLQSLAYIVVMNFGMGLAPGSRIDNFGHLGGFLGGIAYSYLCGPRMVMKRSRGGKLLLIDVPILSDAVRDARTRLRVLKRLLNGR